MPTAGRLAGAVIFALFGWYIAGVSIPYFPESNAPDYWLPASAGIGLFIGWRVCGSRAGRGYHPAISIGLTCSAAISFWLIFLFGFNQMITNALRLRYDGPMEATVDIFEQMAKFSLYFYDWSLIATVLIGGVICAWITEYFGQRFS